MSSDGGGLIAAGTGLDVSPGAWAGFLGLPAGLRSTRSSSIGWPITGRRPEPRPGVPSESRWASASRWSWGSRSAVRRHRSTCSAPSSRRHWPSTTCCWSHWCCDRGRLRARLGTGHCSGPRRPRSCSAGSRREWGRLAATVVSLPAATISMVLGALVLTLLSSARVGSRREQEQPLADT